ncbi:FecR family protein [Agriterribacter sp.]|uniref:FecR family protein n=1 Tax=Agriterribacter sp. TaxID=2821509 RepID=UPI002C524353|nr:FecR domain-containing protein [Agriterribacter sp.]HTN08741.1 FecR domain-containing protein [Agriterribacter sp.]
MKEARIYILLGKKLSNEATQDDLAELEQLLQDKHVEPYLVELLREVWQKKARIRESELDEKWERAAHRMVMESEISNVTAPLPSGKIFKLFSRRAAVAAAGLTGLMLLSVWLLQPAGKQQHAVAAVIETKDSVTVVPRGERKIIMLPDSTNVHLNSGSSLVYNKDFGNNNREVWLKGEGFFEVTKDAVHPFWVNTSRMTVKVLGTVFNVKAYDTREDIETTVVEGKVEVSLKEDAEKKVILLPNEKISLRNSSIPKEGAYALTVPLSYEVQAVKPDKKETTMPEEAVWVKEKLVFTQEPLEIVALKMERWYNVHIHFKNEKMKNLLMTGDFDNVSLSEAMHVLKIMVGFEYDINGNDVFIR